MSGTRGGANVLSLAVAIGSVTAVGLGISLAMPLLSLTLERRGIEPAWIGVNAAAWGFASMVSTPFVPRVAARVGTGVLLAASILVAAVCLPLFYLVENFWLWFLLRFITGSAMAATFVLSEFWIATAAPEARRGLVMGIYATVLAIGLACGPAVLALTGTAGFLPFIVGALVMAAAAIPVIVAPVTSPRIEEQARGAFLRFLLIAPAATAGTFVFGLAESGSFALLPVYGNRVGLPEQAAILLAVAMTLGNVALQIPLGLVSDRFDRRRVLLACGIVGLAAAILLPFGMGGFWTASAILFVWGGFIGGLYTVGLAHVAARFTGADLAAVNSTFVFTYAAGALVGPAAVGAGMEIYDPHGFAFALALAFFGYIALVVIRIVTLRRKGRSA